MSGSITEGYFTEVAAEWNGTNPPTPVLLPIAAAKLRDKKAIDGVNFDGTADIAHYARCGEQANVAAKTVTVEGFKIVGSQPVTGAQLIVNFTNGNTAASPTLSVNHSNPAFIKYRNGAVPSGAIAQNGLYLLVFDGTSWQISANLPESVSGSIKYGGTFDATSGIADISSAAQTQLIQHGLGNNDTQIKITIADNLNTTPKSFGYASNVDIYYICQVAGTMFSSPDQITFAVGDWIISNGNGWSRIVMSSIPVFQKGNESNPTAPGVNGLVPGPSFNQGEQFLTGNGVWSDINAASGVRLGGFKTGFTDNEREFGVRLASQKAYVEIPTENNPVYIYVEGNGEYPIQTDSLCAVATNGKMYSLVNRINNTNVINSTTIFPIGAKIYWYNGDGLQEQDEGEENNKFHATFGLVDLTATTSGIVDTTNFGSYGTELYLRVEVYNYGFKLSSEGTMVYDREHLVDDNFYIHLGRTNENRESFQLESDNGLYYYDYDKDELIDYATYLASLKQDKLNAGNNIQINGNTISATDTTYDVFSDETSQGAGDGVDGLVPSPAYNETNKYLRGDGVWATPSTGLKVWAGTFTDTYIVLNNNQNNTLSFSPSGANAIKGKGVYKISLVLSLYLYDSEPNALGTATVRLAAIANGDSSPTDIAACLTTVRYGGYYHQAILEGYIVSNGATNPIIPTIIIYPEITPSNSGYLWLVGKNLSEHGYYSRISVEYLGDISLVNMQLSYS